MKITETCRCSASLTVEDDDSAAVLATQKDWVGRHQCDGSNPHWADRTGSTSATFGFSSVPQVWRARFDTNR